jgi:cephalosporin hydroxylase
MNHLEQSLDLPLKNVLEIMQDRILHRTHYFGVQTFKNPLDFWIYQEMIVEQQPDVIIEVGNYYGGSTLALAHLCDLLGKGRVIGLDIIQNRIDDRVRRHPRITLIEGDACETIRQVEALINLSDRTLVIEDSSHTYENTLRVIRTFSRLIKPGGYLIVEDSNCHHGLDLGPSPGPYEAIETFVAENNRFQIDRSREDFLITWNPKGFLKRIA